MTVRKTKKNTGQEKTRDRERKKERTTGRETTTDRELEGEGSREGRKGTGWRTGKERGK